MGLFDIIFSRRDPLEAEPSIVFGRFTDSFKPSHKYDSWDESIKLYEGDLFLNSFKAFLEYLKSDTHDNVRYTEKEGAINFSIFQGSKKMEGRFDHKELFVEAKIAKTQALHVGFMRRLIEDNYLLKYCRYALDEDDNITIVFNSFAHDASPYKLYYAFKELAIHADKLDDVLVDEFDDLDVINVGHVRKIPKEEKATKSKFLLESIDEVLNHIKTTKLDVHQYPGAVSFSLLALSYRLDYFIKPEGFVMEKLESIHNGFFRSKESEAYAKNNNMIKLFEEIMQRDVQDIEDEMYEVLSSFGVTSPVSQKQLSEFIMSELPHMDWYLSQGYHVFAQAIPDYIVGYALFNYGMSKPASDYFHLYYEILYSEFFDSLGFKSYRGKDQELLSKKIKKSIQKIAVKNSELYANIEPNLGLIDYSNDIAFATSYLSMIASLDLGRTDHKEVS